MRHILDDGGVQPATLLLVGVWWNGRHRGLKNLCRKACGFESRHPYHLSSQVGMRCGIRTREGKTVQ